MGKGSFGVVVEAIRDEYDEDDEKVALKIIKLFGNQCEANRLTFKRETAAYAAIEKTSHVKFPRYFGSA